MNCERCGTRVEVALGGVGLCPSCLISEVRGGAPDEDWVRVRFPQLEDAVAAEDGLGGQAACLRFSARDFESRARVSLYLLEEREAGRLLGMLERRARLAHPQIAELLDFGEMDGFLYAIEVIPAGDRLEEKIRDAEIGRREMLDFLPKISEIVRFAAAEGVDLPGDPRTVYVDDAGDVRLSGMPLESAVNPGDAVERIAQHPSVGTRIASYELVEMLGEGGFAEVYRARQECPVRREVALKILKLGMDTRQVLARFSRERQALAQMTHSNIARVYDAGATPAGRPYIVMELVDGEPLTTFCDRRALPLEARVALLAQLCRAVEHGHGKGVVHRDLKPSNVLVAEEDGAGVPKVIDFGIARVAEEPIAANTFFTHAQQFVGSPSYMSPEQVGGEGEIDARSDVYSLGSLLYEQLAGEPPLAEDELAKLSLKEVIGRVQSGPPEHPADRFAKLGRGRRDEVAALRSTEPKRLAKRLAARGLADIALKALSAKPAKRYGSAAAMAEDLESWVEDKAVRAPRRRRRAVHRIKRAAVGAALLAVGLGVAWYHSPLGRRIPTSRGGDGTIRPVALYHFDGNTNSDLAGGPDLVAVGAPDLKFETAQIAGAEADVLHFPRFTPGQWLKLDNVIGVNGPWFATETNEFTLVFDVMFPDISGPIALFQCHSENRGYAEIYVGPRGLGDQGGNCFGEVRPGEWNRIAVVGSTSDRAQLYALFLNGTRLGVPRVKGRHSAGYAFDDEILIFADGDQRTGEGYLSSLAVYDVPLTAEEVRALSSASPEGIPRELLPGPPAESSESLFARQRIAHGAGTEGQHFGSSVAVAGRSALVAAPWADTFAPDGGAVWEYRQEPSGAWGDSGTLLPPPDLQRSARFGEALAFSGDGALVFAPGVFGGARVYLYRRRGAEWAPPIELLRGADGQIGFVGKLAVVGSEDSVRLFDAESGEPRDSIGAAGAGQRFAVGGSRLVLSDADGRVAIFAEGLAGEAGLVEESSFRTGVVGGDGPVALVVSPDGRRVAVGDSEGRVHIFGQADAETGGWGQVAEIGRPDATDGQDGFGSALAFTSSGSLLIGAPGRSAEGKRTGAVYLFGSEADGWQLLRVISPARGSVNAQFGSFLSLSGSSLWVGAPADHTDLRYCGAAYPLTIPRFEEQKFDTGSPVSDHGAVVAISGRLAVVGSPGVDTRVSGGGLLALVRGADGMWAVGDLLPHASETRPIGSYALLSCAETMFCASSGNAIFPYFFKGGQWKIGEPYHGTEHMSGIDQDGREVLIRSTRGAVEIARFEGGGLSRMVAFDGLEGDEQTGVSAGVSLGHGIGLCPRRERQPVRVYRREGERWIQSEDIPVPDGLPGGCRFGRVIDHDPDHAVVGAPAILHDRSSLGTKGAAAIVTLDGFSPAVVFTSPNPGETPSFGWSVAIGVGVAYVGEPYVDRGLSPGRVHEYRLDPSTRTWHHQATLMASNAVPGDEFGVSLALDDGWLIVGAQSTWVYLFRHDGFDRGGG